MSAFPIDAALEGFRFTREHPRAVAIWTALSFAVGLAGAAVLVGSGAQAAIAGLPPINPADPDSVNAVVTALPQILPGAALQLAFSFACFAVLSCSAFRALLREPGVARLRLGADELRMMGLLLTLGVIGFVIQVVCAGLTGVATLLAGGPETTAGAAVFALGEVVSLVAQGVVMVRLALASPMSVAEGRWSLAASWGRTRGRFWSMLGALVIAALLYLVVAFLVSQLFRRLGAIARIAEGGALPKTPMGQFLDPAALIVQAGLALAFALGIPILAGPLAAAYRRFR